MSLVIERSVSHDVCHGGQVVLWVSTNHTCGVPQRYEQESRTRHRDTVYPPMWGLVEESEKWESESESQKSQSTRRARRKPPRCCSHHPDHSPTEIQT